jgi:2-polyprenyl-3-methyl-5-hydroxy-6-metoxy-1,4-benzoquinol methylase
MSKRDQMSSQMSDQMDEAAWWNAYGELVEQIWNYDDYLHQVVRGEYLAEMEHFLFKPGGRLLDFGCGRGMLSLPLAQRGMNVVGVDTSAAEIATARERAAALGLSNAEFQCADELPPDQRGTYDAIMLHSVLHHVDKGQRDTLLSMLVDALAGGGHFYIYEPLIAEPGPPWQAWITDRVMGAFYRLLRWGACTAHLYVPEIGDAIRSGWRMRSPEESPNRLSELLELLPPHLSAVRVTPWHCWSVEYANICMSVQPVWRRRLERLAPVIYGIDRRVSHTSWYPYLRSWPFVSITAIKEAGNRPRAAA